MIISIEEFLEHGAFGPLKIGVSKATVISILGEPTRVLDLGETGTILVYGWYEFFFDRDGLLCSIQNDNYNPKEKNSYFFKNEKIEIDSWFLNGVQNQSIGDIAGILDGKGLDYEVVRYYGRDVIYLKSGVVIDFDEEENECGIKSLVGIRLWPHVHPE